MNVEDTFGEWTVVETNGRKALCRCSCGATKWVWRTNLSTGKSTSCGHVRNNYNTPNPGDVIGEWKIIGPEGKHHVIAQCSCGTTKKVYKYTLGTCSTSCGCTRRVGPRSRLKQMWKWMMSRCYNNGDPMYPYYGMKGVTVCEEWREDPDSYVNWAIEQGFKKNAGLQIDRIDNDGPYSPDNCRVTTATENANNKSNNVYATAWGERRTLGEWAADDRCVVGYSTLWWRVRKGWEVEMAMTRPTGR